MFGCSAYAYVRQNKLEPRALKCIFLGYPEGVKAYRLWCLELGMRKCIISRDVVFNEHEMGNLVSKNERNMSQFQAESSSKKVHFEVELEGTTQDEAYKGQGTSDWLEQEKGTSAYQDDLRDYNLTRDRKRRSVKAPSRYGYADFMAYAFTVTKELIEDEPKSYLKLLIVKRRISGVRSL